nr:T9SS type A sorting domain-containing protein [Niastella populi]
METGQYKDAGMLIFDNLGRLVLTSTLTGNRTTVDVTGFLPGVYLLKIHNGQKVINRKFMK